MDGLNGLKIRNGVRRWREDVRNSGGVQGGGRARSLIGVMRRIEIEERGLEDAGGAFKPVPGPLLRVAPDGATLYSRGKRESDEEREGSSGKPHWSRLRDHASSIIQSARLVLLYEVGHV